MDLSKYKPFAVYFPTAEIATDSERFQNRNDAFSELSADQVANNFDLNKFDAVVIWYDAKQKKYFVLSGHSRLEGMKRRKELYIPVRFFEGSEAEAIKFARIDANRLANKENLIEDLKAYILSRDGNESKNIKPLSKKDLKQAFKGKEQKLEFLSYLNPQGTFIDQLNNEETLSQFPRIQTFAVWAGEARKNYPDLTNTQEQDIFNFFFGSEKNYKIKKDAFEKLLNDRISLGKSRLFPECETGKPCQEIKDFAEVGENRELYRQLQKTQELINIIQDRLETNQKAYKIYTEAEKKRVLEVLADLKTEQKQLQRDLKIIENQPALFGIGSPNAGINFVIHYKKLGSRQKEKYFSNATNQTQAKRELKEFWLSNRERLKTLQILKVIAI